MLLRLMSMKSNTGFLIHAFIITGLCLMTFGSCKKDELSPLIKQLNISLVNIPGGSFIMGSPTAEESRFDDETQHRVTLSDFKMSKYEITNSQYAAFLNTKNIGADCIYAAGSYPTEILIYPSYGTNDFGLHYSDGVWAPVSGFENNPVIYVSWYGATEFAIYTGGRLPTEAEWEYACRAGTTTPFNTGDCLTNTQANYYWVRPYGACTNTNSTSPAKTQAIGTYSANAYGLCDMHGNAREWCSDWYGAYPTISQTNPKGPATGSFRVERAGTWNLSASLCRSALRGFSHPYWEDYSTGFRLVFP
jgi:formylglycine-generating enzyme required for sulfatase activity